MRRRGNLDGCLKFRSTLQKILVACPLLLQSPFIYAQTSSEIDSIPPLESTNFWVYGLVGLLTVLGITVLIFRSSLRGQVARRTHELQNANDKHERLVNNLVGTFFYRIDVGGRLSYVSSSITKVLGYTVEEYTTDFRTFLTKNPANIKAAQHTSLSMKGLEQWAHEVQILHKGGGSRWLAVTESPVVDGQGNVIAVEGVAHDITESKQAERELRLSEAFLQHTGKTAKIGGWERDLLSDEVRWTDEVYRIHDLPVSDTPPPINKALGFYPQEDREKMTIALQRVIDFGELYDLELRFITAKGKHLWVRTICSHLNSDGNKVQISGTLQDITEQKRVEEKQRRINQQLQESINQMPVGYILWDSDFRVIEWNESAESIFGYSKEEMLGRFPIDYIVSEDMRPLVRETTRKLQNGEMATYSEDGNNIRKDGSQISCHWSNLPLKNEEGETTAILSMVVDVTEKNRLRKHSVRARRNSARSLSRRRTE